jgi:hypothetical protein
MRKIIASNTRTYNYTIDRQSWAYGTTVFSVSYVVFELSCPYIATPSLIFSLIWVESYLKTKFTDLFDEKVENEVIVHILQ